MNKQLTKYFNRTQTWNFNFINDIHNDLFFEEIKKDIQTDIDKNLLDNPNTTCNYLMSIYKQIEKGQNYIHKRYIVDITNRIINKDTSITPEESKNFENAGYVLTDLDEIKDIILDAIKTVKPELIKAKKQTPDNASSDKEIKYLKPNGEKYTQSQIVWFIYKKNYKNKLYDPRHTDESIFHQLALEFGYTSKTSAYQIYQKWYLKGGKSGPIFNKKYKNELKDINEIIELLDPKERESAKEYLSNHIDD